MYRDHTIFIHNQIIHLTIAKINILLLINSKPLKQFNLIYKAMEVNQEDKQLLREDIKLLLRESNYMTSKAII